MGLEPVWVWGRADLPYSGVFTGKVGWGSYPPHLKFWAYSELILTRQTYSEPLLVGLKIEHAFTGKSVWPL